MHVSPLEYLRHILEEAKYLTDQAGRVSKEQFMRDERLDYAADLQGLHGLQKAENLLQEQYRVETKGKRRFFRPSLWGRDKMRLEC